MKLIDWYTSASVLVGCGSLFLIIEKYPSMVFVLSKEKMSASGACTVRRMLTIAQTRSAALFRLKGPLWTIVWKSASSGNVCCFRNGSTRDGRKESTELMRCVVNVDLLVLWTLLSVWRNLASDSPVRVYRIFQQSRASVELCPVLLAMFRANTRNNGIRGQLVQTPGRFPVAVQSGGHT